VDRTDCRGQGQLKANGYKTVDIQHVGFLCDHVEILYDIDISFQETARDRGIKLIRAESLNDAVLLRGVLEDLDSTGRTMPQQVRQHRLPSTEMQAAPAKVRSAPL
jgi:hypothetical protein